MTEEKTIEQKKAELEGIIKSSKKEILAGVAKAAATVVLPMAALGGGAVLVSQLFENQDLARLVTIVGGVGIGYVFGSEVIEKMKDAVENIRFAYSCLAYNRKELCSLGKNYAGESK